MIAAGSIRPARLAAQESASPAGKRVSFNEHIRPIFVKHCVACHGGVKQVSGLSFIYREQALAEAESGLRAIVPGSVEESYLIERVSDPDPEFRMPPAEHGPPLSAEEIDQLKNWIEQGAAWEEHWAFVAPVPRDPPQVEDTAWPRDSLDRFVLARIEAAGLTPSPEANRAAWLRRASLDLTGMPPTPDEYETFAADAAPTAYERAVDRLLASPRFGERWASMWLDLARYADTQGFEKDDHRNAWPFRDWVIRALNDDMPFDEFTVKQLAGDLLPEATLGDRVATAFHRNTQTNAEGGTDDEEFRTAAVLDRVATTWEAWMGSTFRCAQCHDHPYEPIRNREYYEFVALFNTSRDVDVDADLPVLAVPNDLQNWAEASELDSQISELRRAVHARATELVEDASLWQPLSPTEVNGTGQTKLAVHEVDGVAEVVADGAVSARSTYTLRFAVPQGISKIAAVRIDALPEDAASALKTAEMGFVVTRLAARIVSAEGGAGQDLEFAAAYADEPEPLFDPEDSFRDNDYGWGEYTRRSYPRHAAFVLKEVAAVKAGEQLELTIQFNQTATGDIALAIERGRYSVSTSDEWQALEEDPETVRLKEQLADARRRRNEIPCTNLPVMAEQADAFARQTYTFTRGNWLDKGERVDAGVPQALPEFADNARADRLEMARWIVAPENPLTARVLVNRLWQELFGVGLVETTEDFGSSGTPPSHPELLDHLALRLQNDFQWNIKRLLRAIVLSATYRQSGDMKADALATDPRNRLLARGPRTRLTAEMVRDQALALSGRFSPKMFGPPVMPPQPDGVWRSVYNGAQWTAAEGEDRYRRAVYTYWKRTSGYPSMLTFDAPSRDVCVARRIATNTPLQALATMNDEAYIELAQGFAERMEAAGDDANAQIAAGYVWATGQECPEAKLARLVELYGKGAAAFDASPDAAGKLAPSRERYALVIVANAILNLDEVLTK
jgi:hypothetical protein